MPTPCTPPRLFVIPLFAGIDFVLPGAAAENANGVLADAGVPAGAIASGKIVAIDLVAAYACLYWAAGFFVRDL